MVNVYYIEISQFINFCRQKTDAFGYPLHLADSEDLLHRLMKKVNKQRRSKILRCKNEKDKWRSLLAGLLLRFALEQEGIDYKTAEFACGEYGKPVLLHYEHKTECEVSNKINFNYKEGSGKELFFSLTHSANYVGCAISDENVGIDIEETDRKLFLPEKEKQLMLMAKRICTDHEYAYIWSLPKEERMYAYLELWTRKESLAKADGRGLAIGFEKNEVLKAWKLEEEAAKADGKGLFYTQWIAEGVCMSLYSEDRKEHGYGCSYVACEELLS
uniref:4'-phosphopantetheinyl transferase family protein n=1 Tax=Agathobacter sp. TaxID=2021311 RepID=UPI00405779F9